MKVMRFWITSLLVAACGSPTVAPADAGDAGATDALADTVSPVDASDSAVPPGEPTPQAGDTIVFDDDFETGDFSKWKVGGHITYAEVATRYVVDTTGYQSGHSARVTIGSGAPQYGINVAFLPGYDEIYVGQVGPETQGMVDFYRREILPKVA